MRKRLQTAQTVMFCTNTEWCDFVVWMKADLYVKRIKWEEAFCQSVLPKLTCFFFDSIPPELTLPQRAYMNYNGTKE